VARFQQTQPRESVLGAYPALSWENVAAAAGQRQNQLGLEFVQRGVSAGATTQAAKMLDFVPSCQVTVQQGPDGCCSWVGSVLAIAQVHPENSFPLACGLL
jgi:hypothetical protein